MHRPQEGHHIWPRSGRTPPHMRQRVIRSLQVVRVQGKIPQPSTLRDCKLSLQNWRRSKASDLHLTSIDTDSGDMEGARKKWHPGDEIAIPCFNSWNLNVLWYEEFCWYARNLGNLIYITLTFQTRTGWRGDAAGTNIVREWERIGRLELSIEKYSIVRVQSHVRGNNLLWGVRTQAMGSKHCLCVPISFCTGT